MILLVDEVVSGKGGSVDVYRSTDIDCNELRIPR